MAAGFFTKDLSELPSTDAIWVEFANSLKGPVHGAVALDPTTGLALDTSLPTSVTLPELTIANSVTSATNLFSIDMQGYNSLSFDLINTFVATIQFESSEDNVNWRGVLGLQPTTGSSQQSSSTSAAGMWRFGRMGRYFRARVSSYTSGTVQVIGTARGASYIDTVNAIAKPTASNAQSQVPTNHVKIFSAASNNATNVKNGSAILNTLFFQCTIATDCYVKFYNKATTPAPASDTPLFTLRVPASGIPVTFAPPTGKNGFALGMGYAIVTGKTETDNVAVAAGDVIGFFEWN